MDTEKDTSGFGGSFFKRLFLVAVVITVAINLFTGPTLSSQINGWIENISDKVKYTSAAIRSSNEKNDRWQVVFMNFSGPLGNQMFILASAVGIAERNGRYIALERKITSYLSFIFPMVAIIPEASSDKRLALKSIEVHTNYDSVFEALPAEDCEIKGNMQSWRYFNDYAAEVRTLFRFSARYQRRVLKFFRQLAKKSDEVNVTFVGVHVSRRDILDKRDLNLPGKSYVLKAMEYFRSRYKHIHFVVCSDNLKWCRQNLSDQKNVTFCGRNCEALNMAILAHCHHTVMTVGSFGWWASWLANGTTVYYEIPSINETKEDEQWKPDDYFMPNWIAMSD